MAVADTLIMWPKCGELSFPRPMEVPYEIWLYLAQWFLRRRRLKSVDDWRMAELANSLDHHLDHVTQMWRINFRSPGPWRLHVKFSFIWPSGFWEENVWTVWTTDGWRSLLIVLIIILIMWPRCGDLTSVAPVHWGSMWNLALSGPVVSEEKTFEAF